jgi:hypothetical protein
MESKALDMLFNHGKIGGRTMPICSIHEGGVLKHHVPLQALFGRGGFLSFGVSYPAQFESTGKHLWTVR